jgi:CRP-like cAMP-binding protein
MTVNLATDVEALRRLTIFADIELSKLKLLAFTSERVSFQPGDLLFRQDDAPEAAFVILEGRVRLVVDTPAGQRDFVDVPAGGIVGEIGILCDHPRIASAQAITPVNALRIARDPFLRMLMEFPHIAITVMRELALRLERTTRELWSLPPAA